MKFFNRPNSRFGKGVRNCSVVWLGLQVLLAPPAFADYDLLPGPKECLVFLALFAGAVAVPSVVTKGYLDLKTETQWEYQRVALEDALDKFRTEKGAYPPSLEDIPMPYFNLPLEEVPSLFQNYTYEKNGDFYRLRLTQFLDSKKSNYYRSSNAK